MGRIIKFFVVVVGRCMVSWEEGCHSRKEVTLLVPLTMGITCCTVQGQLKDAGKHFVGQGGSLPQAPKREPLSPGIFSTAFSRPSCPRPPRFCVSLWTVRSATCGLVPTPHPLVSPAWPLVTLLNLSSTHWIVKVARSQMLTRTLLFPSTGPPGFWGKGRIKTCDKPLFRNCDFGANRPDSILAGLTFKGVQAFILSCGASVGPFSTQR